MLLEICANSYQSAKNAQEAGALRIELCQELSVGGVTPSYGLIKQVKDQLSIETFVLIRPRSGNFNYSEVEFEIMKHDIQLIKEIGCHGIVSGVLNADNTLDIARTKELIELSKPMSFTFHRAFDCVPNPFKVLEQLIDLGVDRILTSGQANSAEKGLELLKKLNKKANNRITILAGSGINLQNVELFKNSGFNEIHTSASKVVENKTKPTRFDTIQTESDVVTIQFILKAIQDEV